MGIKSGPISSNATARKTQSLPSSDVLSQVLGSENPAEPCDFTNPHPKEFQNSKVAVDVSESKPRTISGREYSEAVYDARPSPHCICQPATCCCAPASFSCPHHQCYELRATPNVFSHDHCSHLYRPQSIWHTDWKRDLDEFLKRTTRHEVPNADQLRIHTSYLIVNFQRVLYIENSYDVTVKVGSREFHCHSLILISHSEFFFDHLTNNGKKCISLDCLCVSEMAFCLIYRWLYTANLLLEICNLVYVWVAAKELGIKGIIILCRKFCKSCVNVKNAMAIWELASQFGLCELRDEAGCVLVKNFSCLVRTPQFLCYELEQVVRLLRDDDIVICTEKDVFDAAIRWIRHNWPERHCDASTVLSYVRFPLMSPEELLQCFQSHCSAQLMKEACVQTDLLQGCLQYLSHAVGADSQISPNPVRCRTALVKPVGNISRQQTTTPNQAATVIQAAYRGYVTRKIITFLHCSAMKIQSFYRGYRTRKEKNCK